LVALAVLFLNTFLAPAGAGAAVGEGSDGTSESFSHNTVELLDDDAGSALFDELNLSPGDVKRNCIAVSHRGPNPPTEVRLHGTSGGTGLDRYLDMTIEAGSGGRMGDCTGFTGVPLYKGTLAGFTREHADFSSGLLTPFPTATPSTSTFRFTFVAGDDPTAQGRTASATLTWEAHGLSPTPPEDLAPSFGGSQGRTPPGGAKPNPDDMAVLGKVVRIGHAVAEKASFPLFSLLIVILFLLVQDRIDRRDPKLALAPVHAEPDLGFTGLPRGEDVQ
jgi:hypothetical protein